MLLHRIFRRITAEIFVRLPIAKTAKVATGVTVSLTSFPARLADLHLVIRSLLKQTVMPERVVLYLDIDTPDSAISKKLRRLEKYRFVIKTGYEDIKPHKKYFWAMQEYPEDIIITVDDDSLYDRNLVRDLLQCHAKYPEAVCARRVNKIEKNADGSLKKSKDFKWESTDEKEPSFELIATGCGGVLYPPNTLPKEAFNINAIRKYCLTTDDYWLKFYELKNRRKVVWSANKVIHPLSIKHSQDVALVHSNAGNKTDENIRMMQEFTGIHLADFCK